MTPVQVFGIVVRTVGLLLVLTTVVTLVLGMMLVSNAGADGRLLLPWIGGAVLIQLAVGLWMTGGAKLLIRYAYRQEYR
jgi:hypothetical protein